MGSIDMNGTPPPGSMSNSPVDGVQGGGGGTIEMLGGAGISLSHSPVETPQKTSGMSGIEMEGTEGLISPSQKVTPYNSKTP